MFGRIIILLICLINYLPFNKLKMMKINDINLLAKKLYKNKFSFKNFLDVNSNENINI